MQHRTREHLLAKVMQLTQFKFLLLSMPAMALSLSLCLLTGCSEAEVQAVTSGVTGALTALEGNKALAEQFVRDVKTHMPSADPQYESIMETYGQARDDYNKYLSQIEAAARTGQ